MNSKYGYIKNKLKLNQILLEIAQDWKTSSGEYPTQQEFSAFLGGIFNIKFPLKESANESLSISDIKYLSEQILTVTQNASITILNEGALDKLGIEALKDVLKPALLSLMISLGGAGEAGAEAVVPELAQTVVKAVMPAATETTEVGAKALLPAAAAETGEAVTKALQAGASETAVETAQAAKAAVKGTAEATTERIATETAKDATAAVEKQAAAHAAEAEASAKAASASEGTKAAAKAKAADAAKAEASRTARDIIRASERTPAPFSPPPTPVPPVPPVPPFRLPIPPSEGTETVKITEPYFTDPVDIQNIFAPSERYGAVKRTASYDPFLRRFITHQQAVSEETDLIQQVIDQFAQNERYSARKRKALYDPFRKKQITQEVQVTEGKLSPKESLNRKVKKQKYKVTYLQDGKKVEVFASSIRGVRRVVYGKKQFRVHSSTGSDVTGYFKKLLGK